jgi:hypothetical protein
MTSPVLAGSVGASARALGGDNLGGHIFNNVGACTLSLGWTVFNPMFDKSASFRLYARNNSSSVCMTKPRYDQIAPSERVGLLLPYYIASSPLSSSVHGVDPESAPYRNNTRTPWLQFLCSSIC